jgi:phospholipase C
MDCFWRDVASGSLPHYTFIEPRMLLDENDMHPPFRLGKWVAPSTVSAGERLLADVYNAIRRSRSPAGSNWHNRLHPRRDDHQHHPGLHLGHQDPWSAAGRSIP